MTTSDLDLRLLRFRSRRDEPPGALARELLDAARAEDALEVIHIGQLDDENDPELRTLEGRAFYEHGDLAAAQAALIRAAKGDRQNKEPFRWLARVLIERGDRARAIQVVERGLLLDPQDEDLLRLREQARTASGKPSAPARSAPPRSASARGRKPASAPRPGVASAPARSQPEPLAFSLPFDEEVERDEESPTRAIDLRTEPPRSAPFGSVPSFFPEQVAPSDDTDEDEASEATRLHAPSGRELELLRRARAGHPLRSGAPAAGSHRPGSAEPARAQPSVPTIQVSPTVQVAEPGRPEPPEQVLELLRAQGVFEEPARRASAERWASRAELPRTGTRVSRSMLTVSLGVLFAAGLGYLGIHYFVRSQTGGALDLVEGAREQALDGQHASLLDAEQRLVEATKLAPKSVEALEWLLFVRAARSLEEGKNERAGLRESLQRAKQLGITTPLAGVLEAVVLPTAERAPRAAALIEKTEREGVRDARISYLAGRVAQRAAQLEGARRLLERATGLEPRLSLAWVALGEQARAEGRLDAAREAFERALGADGECLRAEIWLGLLRARPDRGGELLSQAEAWAARSDAGPAEKHLSATARAYAHLSLGQADKAREALRSAAAISMADPELLALLSEQAQRAGEAALALRAARAASEAGGRAARFQALIAAALLQVEHQSGAEAAGGGARALARASTALLSDQREVLELAKRELAAYRATLGTKDDVESSSLLMRIDLRLGANVESLLPAARATVERAPELAYAHLALAEALIAGGQGAQAIAALEPALRLAANSADTHATMGKALVAAGRHVEARQSFERAIGIETRHFEARKALARLLLEAGSYDAALAQYRELESAGSANGRLGIVEALLGKGDLAGAAARFEALPDPLESSLAGVLVRARLQLAQGRAAEAAAALLPHTDEDSDACTPDTLTLHGDASLAEGKLEQAIASYDLALELDPGHPDALLGRARAAMRNERLDQAWPLLPRVEAALAQRPRPPRARALLLTLSGQAAIMKQQLEQAQAQLAKALESSAAPPEARFWYAEALAKTHAPQAGEQYRKYLELEPEGPYSQRAKRALSTL